MCPIPSVWRLLLVAAIIILSCRLLYKFMMWAPDLDYGYVLVWLFWLAITLIAISCAISFGDAEAAECSAKMEKYTAWSERRAALRLKAESILNDNREAEIQRLIKSFE